MKRDIELEKSSHILVFDQEKGKVTFMKMYDAQKAKGLFIKLKYKKFQASISKMRCIDSKRSNDLNCKEAK